MLILFGYSKVGKYNRKNKYIIDRKGFFYDVSREELECFLFTEPLIDQSVKYECQ